MSLGIIGGTSLFGTKLLEGAVEGAVEGASAEPREVETEYGTAYLLFSSKAEAEDSFYFLPRHGRAKNIPPHKINYRANIAAFKQLGVRKIIGVTSVGSLKLGIKPQSFVVPHDYINLCGTPSFYDDQLVHITPGLSEDLRVALIKVVRGLNLNIELVESGVYFQTSGPRLETRAEINFIKNYADIVGMNMASEATLARELGLEYANLSTVDNYAHGISDSDEELDYEKIVEAASKIREDLEKVLACLLLL